MNTVILMGRFVDDPDFSTYKNKDGEKGGRVTFTLAVQRPGKDAGADFIRCTAFGKRAEFIRDYFRRGQRALVTGEWRTGRYENKDGETVYTNDCSVSNVEFADSKKANEGFEDPDGAPFEEDERERGRSRKQRR